VSARRRERKVVTVLFCDLVGFTAKAEELDPEDVDAILGPYHDRVRSELERHGGTVEKFIGDAVMALFGAPVAHEDDPERAVRSALEIRDFFASEGLELRIGITTGEALVSLDASPAEGEGMASGDVVNTAARLQAAAPVFGVLADDTTYRATRKVIDYDATDELVVKGKSRPVAAWLAREAHARFGVDVAHEARSELVGRERELALVREVFDRARHQHAPQLLTLVGVPGIGKSRLVYELSRIVDADPELITWRQGRCLAYGNGVTLWALAEIVKAQAGVLEQDAPEDVAQKLRRAAAETVPESDAAWVEAHLLSLAGLAEEAELGRDRNEAFSAWRRFLEGLAEQRPLVLVFEDLHWADESLLDFVDELVDWLADVPLLVVATARPELLERRPGWGGGKLNATTLGLAPLTDDETARLLGVVLGRSVLSADTQQVLLERAGGNPLYAEQFAELFVERGSTGDLALPETLQGIIAARLDGLSVDEKSLLLDAAVVGKVFWSGSLGRTDDVSAELHALERKGFVRRQRRSSFEGESELAFAHALVRDVAYGQIPRGERAGKHRRVAEWIDSLGRLEDHAELLAHHWRSALDLDRTAGHDSSEFETPARLALRAAGDRASSINAPAAAVAYYDDAVALWPATDTELPALLFDRAKALYHAYDEGRRQEALERARDALLEAGDRDAAGEAEAWLANVAWDRGHRDEVQAHLSEARKLVGDSKTSSAALVLATSARMLEIANSAEEALPLAEAAYEISSSVGLRDLQAHSLTTLGMAKNDIDEGSGVADMERALEIALEADAYIASAIVNNLAVESIVEGDLVRGEELYREALRLAERFGNRANIRFIRANTTWMDYARGRWDEALPAADAFVRECEQGSAHTQEQAMRAVRGQIRFMRGDATALDDLSRAEVLTRGADPASRIAALSVLAAALMDDGRLEEARDLVEEILPLTVSFGAHGVLVLVALVADRLEMVSDLRDAISATGTSRARRWRTALNAALAGDAGGAADVLGTIGFEVMEAQARFQAGLNALESGRPEATAELERALSFYRSVGATRRITEIEQALAGAQSASA